MSKIKIGLVDDHRIFRKSLSVLIEMLEDFEIVMDAGNGTEMMEKLKQCQLPDIILMDITMPFMDGIESTRWIQQEYPAVKVIALTMIKNDFVIPRMIKNGAKGYMLKDCEPAELKAALYQVLKNGFYYNELIRPKMKYKIDETNRHSMVNEQEMAFIRWACSEKNHKEIAEEMKVSPRTVDGYRDSVFKKLNVNTRMGIALYAIKQGLVQL